MIDCVLFPFRQRWFEGDFFRPKHADGHSDKRIRSLIAPIAGLHHHTIFGIGDLGSRRVQTDWNILAEFLHESAHSLINEVILSAESLRRELLPNAKRPAAKTLRSLLVRHHPGKLAAEFFWRRLSILDFARGGACIFRQSVLTLFGRGGQNR